MNRFQGLFYLTRKDNSCQGPNRRIRARLRCRCGDCSPIPCLGSGILTRFPFEVASKLKAFTSFHPPLRADWPMFNCCSHGTLLLIGPHGSLMSICYYHQDLYQCRLQAVSRPTLLRQHRILLTRGGFSPYLPPRSGISLKLQRHPFSGHVPSAGELLHTP